MKTSSYKTPADLEWLKDWTQRVLDRSELPYETRYVTTRFGQTCIYTYQASRTDLPAVFVVPGMRTSAMFWVLNNSLRMFKDRYRIFLIDNIGQPGLSAGTNPDIKNSDYGHWLSEVSDKLETGHAYWIGASFGCQLIVKLSQVAPRKIAKAVFVCPGGVVQIGMTWKNLSANMFIIWLKNQWANQRFIRNVVYGPGFQLQGETHALLSEVVLETVRRFNMRTQYPYPMKKEEFANLKMPLLVLPGENDPMFAPHRLLPRIKKVFPVQPLFEPLKGHGHGSELSPAAAQKALAFFDLP